MTDWNEQKLDRAIIELLTKLVDGQKVIVAELAAIRRGESELLGGEVREIRELRKGTALLREIARDLRPVLSFIKIAIGGIMPVGPVTLNVGDKKVATVLGFDQNGAPFAIDFSANPVEWVDDNEAAVQDAPTADQDALTAIAPGVANITATCAGLTDSETVTVVAQAPVLSSIKISID